MTVPDRKRDDYRRSVAASRSISGIWVGLTRRAGLVDVEPLDPVDLGERLDAARSPAASSISNVLLHGRRRVEVALEGPGVDDLAALLDDAAELDRVAAGRRVAGLLLELATGDLEQLLVAVDLALRDRPVAVVARPRRTARPGGRAGPRAARRAGRKRRIPALVLQVAMARQRSRTCDGPATPTLPDRAVGL